MLAMIIYELGIMQYGTNKLYFKPVKNIFCIILESKILLMRCFSKKIIITELLVWINSILHNCVFISLSNYYSF